VLQSRVVWTVGGREALHGGDAARGLDEMDDGHHAYEAGRRSAMV
jgi:hypothetical protein